MARNTSGLKRDAGPGRPKGSKNKATLTAREAIARLVDDNAPRMIEWLQEIREKNGPLVAFKCVNDLMEYHIPKLARTELTGKDGADLMPKVLTYKVEP